MRWYKSARLAPLGLRRICGTCRHFTGTISGPGDCARFIARSHGLSGARDCADWSRPDPVAELPPKAAPVSVEYDTPKQRKSYDASNRRTVTDERIAAVRAAANSGQTIPEAAEALGLTYYAIRHIVDMYRVKFKGRGGNREGLKRNDMIRAALDAGEDRASIAERFGVTREDVKKVAGRQRAARKLQEVENNGKR